MPETQLKTETFTPYQRPEIIVGGRYQGRRVLLSVEKVEQDSVWYRSLDGHMSGVCTIETFLREYVLVYDPLPDLLKAVKSAVAWLDNIERRLGTEMIDLMPNGSLGRPAMLQAIAKAEGR